MVAITVQRGVVLGAIDKMRYIMAFNDGAKRVHFINLMKSSRDFAGEHLSPISESDVVMLLSKREILDSLNEKLKGTGFTLQLNWSEDQGSTWKQYPLSR